MTSEYHITFKNDADKRRWADLLANVHKGSFNINGFPFEKDVTSANLYDEFKSQSRVFIKLRSGMRGLMFSPGMAVYNTTLSKLEQKGYTLNQKDFEQIRSHIDSWFNSGIQPYVTGKWDGEKQYPFEELLYLIMKVGQTMDNFFMFPVPSIGVIAVCGTYNRQLGPDDYWYKEVSVRTDEYTNSGPRFYFDIDDGFPSSNSYGEKNPVEMRELTKQWKRLPSEEQTFSALRQMVDDSFLVVQ